MQVKILSALSVDMLGKRHWRLSEDLFYEIDGQKMMVPSGFEHDFASVPRLPILYSVFGDSAHVAAVIHDYMYQHHRECLILEGGVNKDSIVFNYVTRQYADAVFRAAAELSEGKTKAYLMWLGVRAGGQVYWET